MKSLTIVRHAKSSWGDPSLDDHDRPLNGRGQRVAPLMGEVLAMRMKAPDIILSSTALRARNTAGIIAAELGYADRQIVEEPRNLPRQHGPAPPRVARHRRGPPVGDPGRPRPGCPGLDPQALPQGTNPHFPTCAASIIELDIDYWGEIDEACGKLSEFLIPKKLLPGA